MKKYIGLVVADVAVAAIYVGALLYINNYPAEGADGLILASYAAVLALLIPLIAIIHGVVSQLKSKRVFINHLLLIAVYLFATIIYLLIIDGSLEKILDFRTLRLFFIVFFSSLIPALITKLIMYLVGKKKANSQPTTDTTE
ncbi:MAG: hypothetical protein E7525_07250 [Ruminococcaceae bacterium]|nr:hypothetical protein [Oscillospiraceae bacterium]